MNSPLRSFQAHTPQLGERVFIDPSAVVIGQVALGNDSAVWPLVAIRGDVNYVTVGRETNIQDGSVLHVTRVGEHNSAGFPLIIGDQVTVGHKAMLHGCTIGNRVLVGMGAIVLDGAVIEDEVLLGAGSLVPPGKRLESGYLYVGNPVKQARPLKPEERAFLAKSAENYVLLKDSYLEQS